MTEENQWYQNYYEQLKENVELKKKIKELKDKLQAIQWILNGTQQPEKQPEKTIWQKNKEEQKP